MESLLTSTPSRGGRAGLRRQQMYLAIRALSASAPSGVAGRSAAASAGNAISAAAANDASAKRLIGSDRSGWEA